LLDEITDAIDRAHDGRPGTGYVPPWPGWLTVALLRQRQRQGWHRYIVNTRLREEEASGDAGPVPGLAGWSYRFHGTGCCLTGPDGETIDVDRLDAEARIIDPYFFAWRLDSVRSRAFPEGRLWRWMPDVGFVVAALSDLRACGVIEPAGGGHHFRLAEALEARVRDVAACDFAGREVQARWSAALGDGEDDATVARHRAWLVSKLEGPEARASLSAAAILLPRDELVGVFRRMVSRDDPALWGAVIQVVRRCGYPDFADEARAVLARLSPTEHLPFPAYEALAYLLEQGADSESLRDRFLEVASVERAHGFRGNPFLGDYAVLALRYFPSLAMALVRRALRSGTPHCVAVAAATLCAIGEAWCVRELTSALREKPGDSYLAEALRRAPSELAREQAERTYVPPEHDHGKAGFTLEEVVHNSIAGLFDDPLARAMRYADDLRARYPGGWEG
jgi:hypothetical protein